MILGAQKPKQINLEAIDALLPYGSGTPTVTVNTAILVRFLL